MRHVPGATWGALLPLLLLLLINIALANPRPAVRGTSAGGKPRRKAKEPKKLEIDTIAVTEPGLAVSSFTYEEVAPLAKDSVEVVVHACCLTASDVQQCRGDWGACLMPLVPGREAVGIIAKVGEKVKGLEVGDRVAVLLGTGLDSEAEDDGADRSTLDMLTTGAAAHRLRVPARWAFELPQALPSAQAAGLLGVGGSVWSQLTTRKLPKGGKVGIVGGGAAASVALQLSEALGFEAYVVEAAGGSASSSTAEVVDATDPEHLRLHTGSFDALVILSSDASVDLGPFLALVVRRAHAP